MSNQGYGRERPDYGSAAGHGAPYPGQGTAYPGQDARYADQDARYTDQGTAYLGQDAGAPPARSSSKGFAASLFDFGFSAFVTPRVVKVVYVLITIVLVLAALVSVAFSFRINAFLGIVDLFILAPLGFLICLALWRMALEVFMVVFRISDDLRSMRERGVLR